MTQRTHCLTGHLYTDESTGFSSAGRRYCKICQRANARTDKSDSRPTGKEAVAAYDELRKAFFKKNTVVERSDLPGLRWLRSDF